ncbi:hypothetical protein Hanom_Chr17g01587311 [Helianthus anomalus]
MLSKKHNTAYQIGCFPSVPDNLGCFGLGCSEVSELQRFTKESNVFCFAGLLLIVAGLPETSREFSWPSSIYTVHYITINQLILNLSSNKDNKHNLKGARTYLSKIF